jgi:hypothetical protein
VDLLIDECVPASVTEVFKARGHKIYLVTKELGQHTPDEIVAKAADEASLILVTWNARDFAKLLSRRPTQNPQRFRHAGKISFICEESRGATRAAQVIQSIEFEYQQAQKRKDKRLFIAIYTDYLSVYY